MVVPGMLISTRSEGDLAGYNYQERDRHVSHNSQTEAVRHTCVRLVLCHQMRNFRAMSHFYNINCWIGLIYYIADYTTSPHIYNPTFADMRPGRSTPTSGTCVSPSTPTPTSTSTTWTTSTSTKVTGGIYLNIPFTKWKAKYVSWRIMSLLSGFIVITLISGYSDLDI